MKDKKNQNQRRNQLKTWVRFSNIGLQMAIVIAAGAYLGVWLDEKYPNQYSAFTVVCSLFAIFAALYNVFRQLKNINKNSNS